MKELLHRMLVHPVLAVELLGASFFINFLGVASSLYVIQVLNRYVTGGIDETLFTLTAGVSIAIVMEFIFRQIRFALAHGISFRADARNAQNAFDTLTKADIQVLDQVSPGQRREVINGLASIRQAYTPLNISHVLDVPFALLYVGVLFLLTLRKMKSSNSAWLILTPRNLKKPVVRWAC